jgi:hypothetical protein
MFRNSAPTSGYFRVSRARGMAFPKAQTLSRSALPVSGFRNSIELPRDSFSGNTIKFVPEIPETAVGTKNPSSLGRSKSAAPKSWVGA